MTKSKQLFTKGKAQKQLIREPKIALCLANLIPVRQEIIT